MTKSDQDNVIRNRQQYLQELPVCYPQTGMSLSSGEQWRQAPTAELYKSLKGDNRMITFISWLSST